MIPRIETTWQEKDWQSELANAITDPVVLLQRLSLSDSYLDAAQRAAKSFPLRVTESYLSRMQTGDPRDPLLLQVLPLQAELESHPNFSADPVGDIAAFAAPGLLHKYHGRALLITTQACGIHCRYCFRRHYPYQAKRATENWRETLAYIQADESVEEVILSGGDPLSLNNQKLGDLFAALSAISHVKRLRIHTRFPIILPHRVDSGLLKAFNQFAGKIIMVVHANHAQELTGEVPLAINLLINHDVTLLNQSVLLKHVNADSSAQCALQHALFNLDITPYYLHLLDKVQGAQHFDIPLGAAQQIYAQMQQQLPGYMLPKLVRETAGEPAKSLVPIID